MKSPYKCIVGGAIGLGLLGLTSSNLNYRETNGYKNISKPPLSERELRETRDSIREGMLRELRKFNRVKDEESRNILKGMLLKEYLDEMEARIVGNLIGRYTKFEVVDYIDALTEVIMRDDDLPDEYALQLEKSKEFFLKGEGLLKKAIEEEKKKKNSII